MVRSIPDVTFFKRTTPAAFRCYLLLPLLQLPHKVSLRTRKMGCVGVFSGRMHPCRWTSQQRCKESKKHERCFEACFEVCGYLGSLLLLLLLQCLLQRLLLLLLLMAFCCYPASFPPFLTRSVNGIVGAHGGPKLGRRPYKRTGFVHRLGGTDGAPEGALRALDVPILVDLRQERKETRIEENKQNKQKKENTRRKKQT